MGNDTTQTNRSEAETEQEMYQSMATYMQDEKGMDVTPGEIQQMVEEQTSDTPPEPSEKDQEIMKAMAEFQAEHMPPEAYLVRGALLYCQYGTHCRKLNLPRCHGVYVTGHPKMNQRDCVGGMEGANINITTFGICKSPSNPSGGHICLVKEAPRNPDGTFTGAPAEGTESGIPCLPDIIGEWECPHMDARIGTEKAPSITTQSFLVCSHGGLIQVWRSGQEEIEIEENKIPLASSSTVAEKKSGHFIDIADTIQNALTEGKKTYTIGGTKIGTVKSPTSPNKNLANIVKLAEIYGFTAPFESPKGSGIMKMSGNFDEFSRTYESTIIIDSKKGTIVFERAGHKSVTVYFADKANCPFAPYYEKAEKVALGTYMDLYYFRNIMTGLGYSRKNIEPIGNNDLIETSKIKEFKDTYGTLIEQHAAQMGVKPEVLGGIVYTESNGVMGRQGLMTIRFENHYFRKRLKEFGYPETVYNTYFMDNGSQNHKYRTSPTGEWQSTHDYLQPGEYAAFSLALSINEEAAYRSISMGFGQVMGNNYETGGYSSAKDMFDAYSSSASAQVKGFCDFIEVNGYTYLLKDPNIENLRKFGSKYNGDSTYGNRFSENINLYREA